MGKTLQELLETQFNLLSHTSMTIADFDENDAKDNDWFLSRLIKQRNDEIAARKGNEF